MARSNKKSKSARKAKNVESKVTIESVDQTPEKAENGFSSQMRTDLENKNAMLNLVLGALIIIVAGILVFNYFSKNRAANQSSETSSTATQQAADVAKDALPGNYTIKTGDTLFTVAQSYYGDGWKYTEIIKANNLPNPDAIEVGQVVLIPKLDTAEAQPTAMPSDTTMQPSTEPSVETTQVPDQTQWGPRIDGDTYTVQQGDWLSAIAGRAYGDPSQYIKIIQANNLTRPDNVEVGTVLKLPR